MPRSPHLLRILAPAVLVALVGGACSSSKSSSSSTTAASSATTAAPGSTAAPTTAAAKVSGTLNGSGSTFQLAYDQAAIQAFQQANSGATINYQGKGSGAGQTDLANQVVDFAGSDVAASSSTTFKGGSLLYFPFVLGPITVSYNLSGHTGIKLSGETIAKIFALKITNWNDPAIAADGNSGLPNQAITVVHRSDSSGTTANFTAYLNAADKTDWTLGTGKTVNWASNTVAGNGNNGVATAIKGKAGAIGYVDYSDAKAAGLSWAMVKNAAGNFVDATLDGASASAGDATVKDDLTYNPINQSGAQDYPITSPTYIITYAKYSDAGKVALLKAFLHFILGTDGQNLAKTVDFAPISSSLDQKATAQIDQITTG
ncbi:MAG TPA: phosphate ABC transporter substrate-binding protein PstS [Acidimicrobiales bacterium]|nr:phosphate ABC transporter substrate-binding protein PstS [Acidimicrobiales bacterium]